MHQDQGSRLKIELQECCFLSLSGYKINCEHPEPLDSQKRSMKQAHIKDILICKCDQNQGYVMVRDMGVKGNSFLVGGVSVTETQTDVLVRLLAV